MQSIQRSFCGPGNVVSIEVDCGNYSAVFTGIRRLLEVPKEEVCQKACEKAKQYLSSKAAIDENNCRINIDSVYMAAGRFTTFGNRPCHTLTNIEIIQCFWMQIFQSVNWKRSLGNCCTKIKEKVMKWVKSDNLKFYQ